jgi:non-ribosomal peptide synthetase component F
MVLGTAFAGRTSRPAERALGCFVNTVPVRLRPSPELTFTELLGQVRQAALLAAAHQDVPFQAVVERLAPVRSAGHDPVVQVAFGVRGTAQPTYRGAAIDLTARSLDTEDARLDLTLWVFDGPDGAEALWTYRTDLFDPTTVADLHARYAAVLADAVAEPDRAITGLGGPPGPGGTRSPYGRIQEATR